MFLSESEKTKISNQERIEHVKEWRIHIGCHKTATTHFQDMVEQIATSLHEHDLQYIPRRQFRDTKTRIKPGRMNWRLSLGGYPMKSYLASQLGPILTGAPCVMLSEENILGAAKDLLESPIYRRAERRVGSVDVLRENSEIHYFVSIRRFDDIIASAYAQTLRDEPVPGGFERVRYQSLERIPLWTEFIARLSAIVPPSRLRVWRFEDYLSHPEEIISQFLGVNIPQTVSLPNPKRTRSPSWEAIKEIEAYAHIKDKTKYRQKVSKILRQDNGSTKFDPFSPEQREQFASSYERDIRVLQDNYPDMLITTDASFLSSSSG